MIDPDLKADSQGCVLRILNTRPQAQADKWEQRLRSAGFDCLRAPLLQIEPFTESDVEAWGAIERQILSLDQCQHAIFVSQNAVRYGAPWLRRYWQPLPPDLGVYAVGSATAQALVQQGLPVTEPGGSMNSEALLALPLLQRLQGQRVVIFRGHGGRPLLAEKLQQRGARVDYCELYRRSFPSGVPEQLGRHGWGRDTDLVAVHSGEALLNWCQVIADSGRQQWYGLPILVPGERVATLAREAGFKRLLVAENAADQTMLSTLLSWFRDRHEG